MNTPRILAILASVLFVAAVGLATVGSQMVTLGAALSYLSADAEVAMHEWLVRVMGDWSWSYVAGPLLIRPAWLPFGALGLIFVGAALSWPARDATRRSTRRS